MEVIALKHMDQFDTIMKHYASNYRMRSILTSQLVDKGIVSRTDLNALFYTNVSANACDSAVLAAVYRVIYTVEDQRKLPEMDYFFTEVEQKEMLLVTSRNVYDSYPLVFEDVRKVHVQDEYMFVLTYQQITDMANSHMFQIRTDMQRESIIVKYGNTVIPCVKFDEEKVREISNNILQGKQHTNTIRFHLIPDPHEPLQNSFVFDDKTKQLTVKKGLLVNIDGNHRINGIVDAVFTNRNVGNNGWVIVILSVGSPLVARDIIVQEEKRTPISDEHVASMTETEGSRIISKLKQDEEFLKCFQFCTTADQCRAGGGFFVEHLFADAVMQSFNIKQHLRPSQLNSLVSYLSSFLTEFYYMTDEIIQGYYSNYSIHLEYTLSHERTVYGLMYLAATIQPKPDWLEVLEQIVGQIDFRKKINQHYVDSGQWTIRYMKSILTEYEGMHIEESE